MVTSLLFVVGPSGGVQVIGVRSKQPLSKKWDGWNTIVAKFVDKWLQEQTNKWITLNPSYPLVMRGMAPGTIIESDCLCLRRDCKSCVKAVTKAKRLLKIRRGVYGKPK